MFTFLSGFFLLLILPLIVVALGLAIFLGLGWLLATFLPLSLFEATLISVLVALPIIWLYFRVIAVMLGLKPFNWDEDDWDEDDWEDDWEDNWSDEDERNTSPKAYVKSTSQTTRSATKRQQRKKN